jgi:hypothetical protein
MDRLGTIHVFMDRINQFRIFLGEVLFKLMVAYLSITVDVNFLNKALNVFVRTKCLTYNLDEIFSGDET